MEEGMEKRLLVSFALSILVLFLFSWLYSPPPGEEAPAPPVSVPEAAPAPPLPEIAPAPPPEEESAAEAAPAPAAGTVQAELPTVATLETARYRLRFTNEGGVLESAALLEYLDEGGDALELINPDTAGLTGGPFAVRTPDPALDAMLAAALYVVEESDGEVRMRYSSAGVEAVKTFRADPETYRVDVEMGVRRDGSPVPFSIIWRGGFGEEHGRAPTGIAGAEGEIIYRDGTSFERLGAAGIEGPNQVPATAYAGVADRYFMAMFLLPDPRPPVVATDAVPALEGDDPVLFPRLEVPYTGGPVGLYLGPQQDAHLGAVDPTLTDVIDYGIFRILARPMMLGLVFIHEHIVNNWGWSIILLTMTITSVFFPLRLKQQLSMQKMQKIQPQMRTLQDKYKKLKPNDPRRPEVQSEMMGLYKKHGVNPLGGCLPTLLQMPFLISIFWLLQLAIELRQAPWAFWIHDLSAPDPTWVLPVLFGISMFVQQRLMPTSLDPTQAKIMMIMPVMLTWLFLNYPAGLMLYWLTSNLTGVGQQTLIRKYWPSETVKAQPRGKEEPPAIEVEAAPAPEEVETPVEGSGRRRRRRKK